MTEARAYRPPPVRDRLLHRRVLVPQHRLHERHLVELTVFELILIHDSLLYALSRTAQLRWPAAAEQPEITARRIAAVLVANGIS